MTRARIVLLTALTMSLVACGGGQHASGPDPTKTAAYEQALANRKATREAKASATAAARPSPTATISRATATAQPTETAQPTAVVLAADASDLLAYMPALWQLPEGFVLVADGPRTADELAATESDPVGYRERLAGLGFQRAAARTYQWLADYMPGSPPALRDVSIIVSVYDTPDHAREALLWDRDRQSGALGLAPVEVAPLGDAVYAAGQYETGAEAGHRTYFWVQSGVIGIQLRSMSAGADVFADVEAMLRESVGPQANPVAALPTLNDMPEGYLVFYEGPQSIEDVAAAYQSSARAEVERLNTLGFSGSVIKAFGTEGYSDFAADAAGPYAVAAGAMAQGGSAVVYAEIHEFGSPEQARAAVEYDHDFWGVKSWDNPLRAIETEPIGALSYALQGKVKWSGTVVAEAAVVLIQDGAREYVFLGVSFLEGAVPNIVPLAQATLERAK
jgi:hypothetical protein